MHCVHCGQRTEVEPCAACGEPPRLVGRYALTGVIGRGTHGTTWRALDAENGEERAIKELPLRLGTPDKQLALFRREAEVLRQLDHPAVPSCHDAFETGSGRQRALWIVLDFIDGPTLEQELTAHRYDEVEVLDILEEILHTLAWLHRRSPPVVHRDLKPANVIRSEGGRLVIVDFGSVRDVLRDPDLGGSTVTGTFGYMAPEQFAGDAEPRTDLFGAGALAITLLTRAQPHTLQDARGLIRWRDRAVVSPAFAQLLDSLVAPEREARPPSAEAALARIGRIRIGEDDADAATDETPVPRDTRPTAPLPTRLAVPTRRAAPPRDQIRSATTRLGGAGRLAFEARHHGRAVSLIERELRLDGDARAIGDTLRWRAAPTSGRQIQVSIEPDDGGTQLSITEDHRPLWGGLLGGLGGGLGGGVGGGAGWLVFLHGGPVLGITFVASVVIGALALGIGLARRVQRARVGRLRAARDALEDKVKGPIAPRAASPPIPTSAGVTAAAVSCALIAVYTLVTVLIGLQTSLVVLAGLAALGATALIIGEFPGWVGNRDAEPESEGTPESAREQSARRMLDAARRALDDPPETTPVEPPRERPGRRKEEAR